MDDLAGIGKIVDSKLAQQAYEDLAQPVAKQTGHLAEDSLKALRLFTAPIQLLATAQDRFAAWLEEVRISVPPDRQQEAAPEIAGPILMNLRFMDDENDLRHLYLNLLKLAIDREQAHRAHPGFIKAIERLSPVDAYVLKVLSEFSGFQTQISPTHPMPMAYHLQQSTDEFDTWQLHEIQISLDVLQGLSLIRYNEEYPSKTWDSLGEHQSVSCTLTVFGHNFMDACMPEADQFADPKKPK